MLLKDIIAVCNPTQEIEIVPSVALEYQLSDKYETFTVSGTIAELQLSENFEKEHEPYLNASVVRIEAVLTGDENALLLVFVH